MQLLRKVGAEHTWVGGFGALGVGIRLWHGIYDLLLATEFSLLNIGIVLDHFDIQLTLDLALHAV